MKRKYIFIIVILIEFTLRNNMCESLIFLLFISRFIRYGIKILNSFAFQNIFSQFSKNT